MRTRAVVVAIAVAVAVVAAEEEEPRSSREDDDEEDVLYSSESVGTNCADAVGRWYISISIWSCS